MDNYQILDWDSEIFGLGVARVLPARLTEKELVVILRKLQSEKIKLVYWASDSQDQVSQQAAQKQQGYLVDRKTTYLMSLSKEHNPESAGNFIEEYKDVNPSEALEFLALQSGMYSRFKVDPNIPNAIFEKIYKLWIVNSTNKKIARAVLIAKKTNDLAGMITLNTKNGRGDIGLLAVHPDYRGMKIGNDLVTTGQQWFIKNDFKESQVVTQLENKPACALYEKCGYKVEKVENFYHFWLQW